MNPCGVRRLSAALHMDMLPFLAFLLAMAIVARAEPIQITVAVAASAQPAVEEIAKAYTAATGVDVLITGGSTGTLQKQAENGAPFDVFFSADSETPAKLEASGVLAKGSVREYARGRLVVWQRDDCTVCLLSMDDLRTLANGSGRLAIANPELAPYGRAAMEVLRAKRLENAFGERLVLGSNVGHAMQIARSGNAEAAFVAASVIGDSGGKVIEVPSELYAPIVQSAGIIAASKNASEAAKFLDFALGKKAEAVFEEHGFKSREEDGVSRAAQAPSSLLQSSASPPPSAFIPHPSLDWRPVWISLKVGGAATVLALVIGSLLGYLLGQARLPGGRVLEAIVLLPLVLPPTVMGFYLLVLIGQRGPIGALWESMFGAPLTFTITAAIIAATVATVPIVATQLRAAFATLSSEVTEAARIDGAHGLSLFLHVHLPLIRVPLAAAAAIAFSRSVGDFGTTLMVAGSLPGKTQTASIAIYDLMLLGRDREALMLVAMISVVSMMVLVLTVGRRAGARAEE